ncbi:DeoR/GlpR family DNA-binding transcription regulator [Hoeflea sp. YIM 152468]|uniref:DeoR/GlpR family DNA-binding transcription regulator n=1 Tax=Hoeflea sp. YIM 152468 TaxID=3031759 RepID=UPI0023DB8341|nr:DeoR/GlpR family DNA-binding transcription regulator [Hoeflea sp. YIM 152468]MDF1607993.1 DeoR/GlpR family DNA-binding transcription regulator [Hoeflea sp. YIM 152468]
MTDLPIQRHRAILDHLDKVESARTVQLAARLGVTRETVRHDLSHLADRGLLRLVYGGAARLGLQEPDLQARLATNIAGKTRIARRAAALVPDGARVALDCGSTTLALARQLRARVGLKLWTNDIAIAQELGGAAEVVLLGGPLSLAQNITTGPDAAEMMAGYNVDFAFISLGGLSAAQGLTDFDRDGFALRNIMRSAATQCYFLADHGKFGRPAPLRWKSPQTARAVICDQTPGPEEQAMLTRIGLPLIRA